MNFYLYILRSLKNCRYYIGITNDIDQRLAKHNSGSVKSTKGYRPWKVIYIEVFQDKTEVRKREIHLKNNALAKKELLEKISNMAPSSSLV
jgi:putative endonuclease